MIRNTPSSFDTARYEATLIDAGVSPVIAQAHRIALQVALDEAFAEVCFKHEPEPPLAELVIAMQLLADEFRTSGRSFNRFAIAMLALLGATLAAELVRLLIH